MRTGSVLEKPRLGLGTAPLGGLYAQVEEDVAHAVVERAWDVGIRLFDTAPLYGSGLAERRLGAILSHKPREEFALMTKVGRRLHPGFPDDLYKGAPRLQADFDFSYDGVLRSHEESLIRLGLDRLDIVLIHDPDDHYAEAMDGAYLAVDRLRAEGTVRAIGVGMNQTELLCRFVRDGDFDYCLLAGRYTLLDTSGADELFPLCIQRGTRIVAGGIFNSGILAGGPTYDYKPASGVMIERAERLREICHTYGAPLEAAAVQFPLAHPAVEVALIGCRTPAEVEQNVRLYELELPHELWLQVREEGLLPDGVPVPCAVLKESE
jgi:D-threo-aldose 1-dehydrogenase